MTAPNIDQVADWAKPAWEKAHKAGMIYPQTIPTDPVDKQELIVFLDRAGLIPEPPVVEPDPEPEPEPPPVVSEPYPANAVLARPGDNIRNLLTTAKVVELADGDYGNQILGSVPGSYLFSRTGNAIFDGGYQVGPFIQPSNGVTLRNFHVRRFIPDGGGTRYDGVKAGAGIINNGNADDCAYIDMTVGLSTMNAYKLNGQRNRIEGGYVYDCHRYVINGGGSHNTVRNLKAERIAIRTNEVSNPREAGTDAWGNRGFCKIAKAGTGWIIEDLELVDCWNGVWFDIANEPATIRNIRGRRVESNLVFLEVSYGAERHGQPWIVENIHGEEMHGILKPTTPDHWPVPALVLSSMTPDVHIKNVTGDGSQHSTVGLIAWKHDQLVTHPNDTSRMGIDGIVIEGTDLAGTTFGFGWEGNATDYKANARHGRPTFVNCTVPDGTQHRWQGSTLTAAELRSRM